MDILKWSIGLTVVFELVTVFFRFVLKMESTRDTASTIGRLTFGIRVHHGYIGVLMLLVAGLFLLPGTAAYDWTVVIGLALFLSDIIHHFLVLWPIVGSPQFDFVYPKKNG